MIVCAKFAFANILDANEHILVRGVNWLGDAVMTTPALQRLREARPSARITMLTPEKLVGLWEGQPFVDEVIAIYPGDSVFHVGRRLRQKEITAGVIFPKSFRSAMELWMGRVPNRIGYGGRGRTWLLNKALPPRPESVPMLKKTISEISQLIEDDDKPEPIPSTAHHIHDYLVLTEALGASRTPLAPLISVTEDQVARLRQKFRLESPVGGRPWFGLNPGAEYGPAKRWPEKRFAATAVALQKRTQCRWLIFGGAGDLELAERIATEIRFSTKSPDSVLNLAGKTSLKELAAAVKLCTLVLTNDTGPMHLAAAVGTPVIVPFGSTSPEMTAPLMSAHVHVLRAPAPCSPCFRRECPVDLRCFEGIKITDAVEAADEILRK